MRIGLAAIVLLALGGCADLPRDPASTERLVRESGTIRLGWVEGTLADPKAQAVLRGLEHATGARLERRGGDSEALLRQLEEGEIDLVYGRFAMASPWRDKVHLGHALGHRAEPPKHVAAARFAYRNGENGWIMLIEPAARP